MTGKTGENFPEVKSSCYTIVSSLVITDTQIADILLQETLMTNCEPMQSQSAAEAVHQLFDRGQTTFAPARCYSASFCLTTQVPEEGPRELKRR